MGTHQLQRRSWYVTWKSPIYSIKGVFFLGPCETGPVERGCWGYRPTCTPVVVKFTCRHMPAPLPTQQWIKHANTWQHRSLTCCKGSILKVLLSFLFSLLLLHLAFHLHLYLCESTFFSWGWLDFVRYLDATEIWSQCTNSLGHFLIPADSLEISCLVQHLCGEVLFRKISNI